MLVGLAHFRPSRRWPIARALGKVFLWLWVGLLSLNDSWQKVQAGSQQKRAASDVYSLPTSTRSHMVNRTTVQGVLTTAAASGSNHPSRYRSRARASAAASIGSTPEPNWIGAFSQYGSRQVTKDQHPGEF